MLNLTCFCSLSVQGFDPVSLGLMALMFVLGHLKVGKTKKKLHPIIIAISAALGVLLFGVIGL